MTNSEYFGLLTAIYLSRFLRPFTCLIIATVTFIIGIVSRA